MPQETVVLTVPASGSADSDPVARNVGFGWNIVELTAEAPSGTNGAILLYQGGQLRKVVNIGEFTSEALTPPISVLANDQIVVRAAGVQPGSLIVNLIY